MIVGYDYLLGCLLPQAEEAAAIPAEGVLVVATSQTVERRRSYMQKELVFVLVKHSRLALERDVSLSLIWTKI